MGLQSGKSTPKIDGPNTKKQSVIDAGVALDKARISALSREADEAVKKGDAALAVAKREEARAILRAHFPKNPGDTWNDVIARLDVTSPKNGAVFWSGTAYQAKISGQPDAARVLAERIGGVTLETTPGGSIIDGWAELDKFPWDSSKGPPPWAGDLWKGVSKKYANSATGIVHLVQTTNKLWDPTTIWHTIEKPILNLRKKTKDVTEVVIHSVDTKSKIHDLTKKHIEQLLKFDQRP